MNTNLPLLQRDTRIYGTLPIRSLMRVVEKRFPVSFFESDQGQATVLVLDRFARQLFADAS